MIAGPTIHERFWRETAARKALQVLIGQPVTPAAVVAAQALVDNADQDLLYLGMFLDRAWRLRVSLWRDMVYFTWVHAVHA